MSVEILSLDVLKLAGIFPRAWRWLRRDDSRRKEEILRYNITGLQIVIINSEGRIVGHSFESSTNQFTSESHGLVESLLISIELERSITAESEKVGPR